MSLICVSVFADTDVTVATDDGNTSIVNTLSWAIDQVNNADSTSPIVIESSASSLTVSGVAPPAVTTSLTVESYEEGTNVTITGWDVVVQPPTGSSTAPTCTFQNVVLDTSSITLNNGNISLATQGTYTVSNDIILGSGSGSILFPTFGSDVTFKGDISGTGPLTFQGSDSLFSATLTGVNSWTGGLVVSGGSVSFEEITAFPDGTDITLNSGSVQFALVSGTDYTISSTISGGGIFLGPGNFTLTGNISNFFVALGAGDSTLSGVLSNPVGYVVDGGSLTLSGLSNTGSFPVGIYEGTFTMYSGEVTSLGLGNGPSQTLDATFISYTDLSISDFTLQGYGSMTAQTGVTISIPDFAFTAIPPNPNVTSLTKTFALNGPGIFEIEQISLTNTGYAGTATLSMSGAISGTNGLTITNPSSLNYDLAISFLLDYTGSISYTGGINIGQTIAGYTPVDGYVTLTMESGSTLTGDIITIFPYAVLSVQEGATVSASSYYTNNGTLQGCGTVTGTVNNNAITTVGCSLSTLTIDGDFISNSGSTLQIFLEPGGTSQLNVLEDVVLSNDVTLRIVPTTGCYPLAIESQFLTVEGSFLGTFSTVEPGTLILHPALTYGDSGASLTMTLADLSNVVSGGNAKAIGSVLNQILVQEAATDLSDFCKVVGGLILLNETELSSVFNQMQPSLFKALTIAQENNSVKVQDSLSYRLKQELDSTYCFIKSKETQRCEKTTKPFHIWINGMGDSLHQKSTTFAGSPQMGYNENMGGASLGMDYCFAGYLYLGALGAYTDSHLHWQSDAGKGSIQSGYAGLYLSALGEMFYGNVSVIGGWSHYKAHRNMFFPEENVTANSKHGSSELLSHLDTGLNLGVSGFTIRPFDSFDYITQTDNAFTETGAGALDLSIRKSNSILLRNELGINFSGCYCFDGGKWTLSPKISWVREVRIKGAQYTASFVNQDQSFTVTGYFPDRSLVSPGFDVTCSLLDDLLTFSAYYNGEFKGNYSDHSYGGQVRLGF